MPSLPINLAVLASGGGTTLQNLIDQIAAKTLNARINIVIASRPEVGALKRASDNKIPNYVIDRQVFSPEEFSQKIFALCDDSGVDLICLAGWMSLLQIPSKYEGKTMNIHPALLPSFGGKGLFGKKVHRAVIDHGCKISGCTVHFVDGQYDNGPIIVQRTCPVMEDDTPESLAARVHMEENIAYPQAIRLFHEGRLKIENRRVRIGPE